MAKQPLKKLAENPEATLSAIAFTGATGYGLYLLVVNLRLHKWTTWKRFFAWLSSNLESGILLVTDVGNGLMQLSAVGKKTPKTKRSFKPWQKAIDRLYEQPQTVRKTNILLVFVAFGNKRATAWLHEPHEPSQHFTR